MSLNMLGKLPLSAVRGPKDTLEQHLAGEHGEQWLKAFNEFLRGENPWPIVSKIIDRGYSINIGDGKNRQTLINESRCDIDSDAHKIILSDQFASDMNAKAQTFDVILLEFDNVDLREKGLRPQNVLAEMRRLGLEPPSLEDALRFNARYPAELMLREMAEIIFLHKPVRLCPYVGPGGMAIGTDSGGKISAVLSLKPTNLSGMPALLTTENTRFLSNQRRFAARRRRAA